MCGPVGISCAPPLTRYAVHADGALVEMANLSDRDMALVAGVIRREGWDDPARPPAVHGARTLDEVGALARFEAASRPAAPPRRIALLSATAKLRIALVVAALAVLGVCWWVSPTRTALGLLGAGAVCLVGMRRRRGRAGRRSWPGGWAAAGARRR